MQGLGQGFRELVYHGAGSVVLLCVAHGEHRREDTLDMLDILQALGDLFEAFGNHGLDVFTQGTLPIPKSQKNAHILESKPCGLRRTNETDPLQSILGIEAVIIVGTSCWRKQARALVVS